MKGAIIGFGNIAEKAHLPAHRNLGIDIVAVVDICHKRREAAAGYGLKTYESLDELGKNESLDFLDICTPQNFRLEAVEFAADNGLDVICEKPICHPDDLDEMVRLVRGSDIFFLPVHNWKYSPHYQKAKEIISSNGGRLERLVMNTLRTSYGTGNEDWDPDWRVHYDISGGGVLIDHGYHIIYLAMYLFGCEFNRAKLNEIEFFEDSKIEKKVNCELFFACNDNGSSCDSSVEINLEWNSDKREIKNVFFEDNHKIELCEKKIVSDDDEVFEFEHALSGDSVHGEWYHHVINDFIRYRDFKDDRYFNEAVKVIEGIKEIYSQVNV